MLLGLVGITVAAALLLRALPTGFVPDEDQGYFFAALVLPDGSSVERTDAVVQRAEAFLKTVPGIQSVVTMGGLNVLTNVYTIVLTLKPWGERASPETQLAAILARVRRELNTYPEAVALVFTPPPIPGLGAAGGFQFMLQDRGGRPVGELDRATRQFLTAAS